MNSLRGVLFGQLVGESSDGGTGWHYQLLPESGTQQLDVLTSASMPSDAVLAKLPAVDISSGSGILSYRVRYYHVHTSTHWNGTTHDKRPAQVNPGTRTAAVTYVLYYR